MKMVTQYFPHGNSFLGNVMCSFNYSFTGLTFLKRPITLPSGFRNSTFLAFGGVATNGKVTLSLYLDILSLHVLLKRQIASKCVWQ